MTLVCGLKHNLKMRVLIVYLWAKFGFNPIETVDLRPHFNQKPYILVNEQVDLNDPAAFNHSFSDNVSITKQNTRVR